MTARHAYTVTGQPDTATPARHAVDTQRAATLLAYQVERGDQTATLLTARLLAAGTLTIAPAVELAVIDQALQAGNLRVERARGAARLHVDFPARRLTSVWWWLAIALGAVIGVAIVIGVWA